MSEIFVWIWGHIICKGCIIYLFCFHFKHWLPLIKARTCFFSSTKKGNPPPPNQTQWFSSLPSSSTLRPNQFNSKKIKEWISFEEKVQESCLLDLHFLLFRSSIQDWNLQDLPLFPSLWKKLWKIEIAIFSFGTGHIKVFIFVIISSVQIRPISNLLLEISNCMPGDRRQLHCMLRHWIVAKIRP